MRNLTPLCIADIVFVPESSIAILLRRYVNTTNLAPHLFLFPIEKVSFTF